MKNWKDEKQKWKDFLFLKTNQLGVHDKQKQ